MNIDNIEGTSADLVIGGDMITLPVAEFEEYKSKAILLSVVEKERDNIRVSLTQTRDALTMLEGQLKETLRIIGEAAQEHLGHSSAYTEFFEAVNGELPSASLDEQFVEYFGQTRDIEVDIEYEVNVSGTVWDQGQSFDISGQVDNVTIYGVTLSDVPPNVDIDELEDPSEYGGPEANFTSTEGDIEVEFTLVGVSES